MKTRTFRICTAALPALLALGIAGLGARAQDASTSAQLPGGASSLQESYGVWSVACRIVEEKRQCAVTQQQVQENGQRVLAIEIRQAAGDALEATLVLPFGLMLDAGGTLAVDDAAPGEPLRFRTCIPAGCLVPATLDAAFLERLRSGKALAIGTTSADGQQTPFSIPLGGFPAAVDRLKALVSG